MLIVWLAGLHAQGIGLPFRIAIRFLLRIHLLFVIFYCYFVFILYNFSLVLSFWLSFVFPVSCMLHFSPLSVTFSVRVFVRFITKAFIFVMLGFNYVVNCASKLYNICWFRTPVSARSYRSSVFLLDWLSYFCQANKFIDSFIHSFIHYWTKVHVVTACHIS